MVEPTPDEERAIVPIARENVLVQKPGDAWPDDIVKRHYELYASLAFKNCAKACRLYQAEHPGEPAPHPNTVREWCNFYGWETMVDGDLERTNGRRLHALRQQWFGLMEQAADNLALAGAGAFDDNPQAGAVRVQVAKIAMEPIVRGVLPLNPPANPDAGAVDWRSMTTEEKEALARDILQGRKGEGSE